jgi:hypothetical protein
VLVRSRSLSVCFVTLACLALSLVPQRASAFEVLDGRVSLHGFYEAQLRGISDDFSGDLDLTQWYNVLDLELEADIMEDPIGPIDMVTGFARVEVRYDCVWTHGCGMFRSVNTYGDNAKHLPERYSGAKRTGLIGSAFVGDTREIAGVQLDRLGFADKDVPIGNPRKPAYLWHFPGVDTLFGVQDPMQTPTPYDDPAFYTFAHFVEPGHEYRFGMRDIPGPNNGTDRQALGPWLPRNKIDPLTPMADRANPFNALDIHPFYGTPGSTELPYRPAPNYAAQAGSPSGDPAEPRGLFIPNEEVARLLRNGDFGPFDQNFRQAELAWNRGASQQDEKELKELYLDIELFDARLWVRLGKQNIVWGKTELFRTTDQLNPQDLALSSLPSLEESRIALWSGRFVWSFWDVGPLSDVRAEVAVNFDQFEPTDLGRCGEPYTPNPVCDKSAGLFAHGLAGFGLAGEVRPPDPWQDVKGVEIGGRVEFRWDRFSFAISDFYGFDDFPYLDPIFLYERNVDPETGRPRRGQTRRPCTDGTQPGCLGLGATAQERHDDVLLHHHANQQRFAVICSSSVGFNDLDRSVCAFSVLNSPATPGIPFAISQVLGHILRGNSDDTTAASSKFFFSQLAEFTPSASAPGWTALRNGGDLNGDGSLGADDLPLTALVDDVDGPNDLDGGGLTVAQVNQAVADGLITAGQANAYLILVRPNDSAPSPYGIMPVLSDEQEALLGCGPFYGTFCDLSGIDFLNAEASALGQSWIGMPGTGVDYPNNPTGDWDTTDASLPQPGTLRFVQQVAGPAVCTRFENGRAFILPGCRGPSDPGYNRAQDGTPPNADAKLAGLLRPHDIAAHPFTGDPWRSEMAALSWNTQMMLVGFSGLGEPLAGRLIDEFDPAQPLRKDGCSFAKPQFCSVVQAFYAVLHTTRRNVTAGGNGTFGRIDFDWHQGGSAVLRYEKRNVLGFSMDFAEDVTKSNWSIETTWIEGVPFSDNDERDGLTKADTYNLTVSVDRPTFINFLNANRTFFFNSQWFFQYIDGYRSGFPDNGPWNVLFTFTIMTGYQQDRLSPSLTLVYDIQSQSGGALPEIRYQFTANFSVAVGMTFFWGRWQRVHAQTAPVGDLPFRAGKYRDFQFAENGISPIRDRDELYLLLHYTF